MQANIHKGFVIDTLGVKHQSIHIKNNAFFFHVDYPFPMKKTVRQFKMH
jgi:hypothetical protein